MSETSPLPAATPLRQGQLAVVAIGRNEGERLRRCLLSIPSAVAVVVYVDSGSSDGSPELASSLAARVVELDPGLPFSAARARNAGFERALEIAPELQRVQFVDGDCSLVSGWIERANEELAQRPELAAVCGRRRELARDASIYNRLCDVEWTSPPCGDVGQIGFGGDVMIRAEAFRQAGGYRESLIAGEDPELSARLRWLGWQVVRLEAPMTLHDADMHSFGQWWRRALRAGHAYAEVAHLHRLQPEAIFRRDLRRILVWGGALPLLCASLAFLCGAASLWLLLAYPLQIARVGGGLLRQGFAARDALAWAVACVVGTVPNLAGVLRYHLGRVLHRRARIIEYHPPPAAGGTGSRAVRNGD